MSLTVMLTLDDETAAYLARVAADQGRWPRRTSCPAGSMALPILRSGHEGVVHAEEDLIEQAVWRRRA